MLAAIAAVSSLILMGVVNFFGPLLTRRTPLLTVVMVAQGAAFVVLLVILAIARSPIPSLDFLIIGSVLGILAGVSTIATFRAGQIGHIGVVSVILAMSAAIPAVAGIIAGDRPASTQWVGIALAAAGTALVLTRGQERERRADSGEIHLDAVAIPVGAGAPAPAMGLSRAAVQRVGHNWKLLATLGAVGFGSFMLGFAELSKEDVVWAATLSRWTMSGVAAVAILALGQPVFVPGKVRKQVLPLPVLGVMMVAAMILYGYASTSMLTIASALTAFAPVITTSLSWMILRERLTPQQVLGLAIAVVGLLLIPI